MKWVIYLNTSTVQPLKFGIGQIISSHTLLGMWLLFHAGGLKFIHVSESGIWYFILIMSLHKNAIGYVGTINSYQVLFVARDISFKSQYRTNQNNKQWQ